MNQIALDFIRARESCRLTAYLDSGGVLTIGWGHTGTDVTEGLVWTQAQADQALLQKVANIETVVSMKTAPLRLTTQQTAALISFAYNEGLGAFSGSTLLKYVVSQEWTLAAKEFPKWDRAGADESRGLLKRRYYEAALFLDGCP